MQGYFYALTDRLASAVKGEEVLNLSLDGERSDFVRLSRNRVRQAGQVRRTGLGLRLVDARRQARFETELSGILTEDLKILEAALGRLREQIPHLPTDPHLIWPDQLSGSERGLERPAPDAREAIGCIVEAARDLDLVGIWASGERYAGFASSLGQRHWHSSASFNFDWSCHLAGDKSVKARYAGSDWDPASLRERMDGVRKQLGIMGQPARTLQPGRYRAYLAPAALEEILGLLGWGAFGLKSHRTGETPLIRMVTEGRRLHPAVSLVEEHARGLVPGFTDLGFVKPPRVPLIESGVYRDCLTSPRSAAEYGAAVNAGGECAESLDMAAGTLKASEVLGELDTGLYVQDLWYTNYSDLSSCRITGMTRFACFWVEQGLIRRPVNVMRFDESLYDLLGDRLVGLSAERELILDASTYGGRSRRSFRLPGALVDGLALTL
jgi:predicted Zn-dependent protease